MTTLKHLAFAAEHLQREGEAQAYADSVAPRNGAHDRQRANGEAYEVFLARRLEMFVSLPERFDGIAIGWHRAAVKLFGERAAEALDAALSRIGQPHEYLGAEDAEQTLRQAMAARETRDEPRKGDG